MSLTDLYLYEEETGSIGAGPAVGSLVALGPVMTQTGDEAAPAVHVEVFHRDDLVTPIAVLGDSHGRRWQEMLSEPGAGALTLDLDDEDLALIDTEVLVRFYCYGWAAFTMLAQDIRRVTVASGEEVDEVAEISGPGHLALLEESLVEPARGLGLLPPEQDRTFGWMSLDFDQSTWDPAVDLGAQSASFPYWSGLPADWPLPDARWLWTRLMAATDAPQGDCYFRREWNMAEAKRLIFYIAADATPVEVWLDGQLMMTIEDVIVDRVYTFEADCAAIDHVLAIKATNRNNPDGNEPAGVLFAASPAPVLGVWDAVEIVSDTTTVCLDYPTSEPGMSVGEAVRLAIDEAKGRGELTGIVLGFSDDADSNGSPWPIGVWSTKVGTDILTFVRELSAHACDAWMMPGSLTLNLYRFGERGAESGVSFHEPTDGFDPTTGNLTSLVHRALGSPRTRLLVQWSGGWFEVVDEDADDIYSIRTARLDLGACQSEAEARAIAEAQLATYSTPRRSIEAGIEPVDDSDLPYFAWMVGDTVTVPDEDGASSTERVVALAVTEDPDGVPTFAPDLVSVLLDDVERLMQSSKKMANGTMRGDSRVATPVGRNARAARFDPNPPTEPEPPT